MGGRGEGGSRAKPGNQLVHVYNTYAVTGVNNCLAMIVTRPSQLVRTYHLRQCNHAGNVRPCSYCYSGRNSDPT